MYCIMVRECSVVSMKEESTGESRLDESNESAKKAVGYLVQLTDPWFLFYYTETTTSQAREWIV